MKLRRTKNVMTQTTYFLVFIILTLFASTIVRAETLNAAVASNFAYTLKLLAKDFGKQTGHKLRISSASTGKLYTQILHGAPFDVFLSADEYRPDLLISKNKANKETAYVYAKGQLVLMSNIVSDGECKEILSSTDLKRLSIANPKTAPYGVATKQVMEKLSLWKSLQMLLVKGENIAQALQFVSTKNAQAGFVAKSMLKMGKKIDYSCLWDVPKDMYSPINQKLVVLKKSQEKPAVTDFLSYMQSGRARDIIKNNGYDVI